MEVKEIINTSKPIIVTEQRVFIFWKRIRKFKAVRQMAHKYWEWVELPNNKLVHDNLSFQLDHWLNLSKEM